MFKFLMAVCSKLGNQGLYILKSDVTLRITQILSQEEIQPEIEALIQMAKQVTHLIFDVKLGYIKNQLKTFDKTRIDK